MAKIRSDQYGFTDKLEIAAAVPLQTFVSISGPAQVSITGTGAFPLGKVISLPIRYPGNCGLQLSNYDTKETKVAGATIAPGDRLKLVTNTETQEQKCIPFVAGTDDPGIEIGIAVTGANTDGEFTGYFK